MVQINILFKDLCLQRMKLCNDKNGELILEEWVSHSISLIFLKGRVVEIVPNYDNSLLSYLSILLKDKLNIDSMIHYNSLIIKNCLYEK